MKKSRYTEEQIAFALKQAGLQHFQLIMQVVLSSSPGLTKAHITGAHLLLPDNKEDHSTLEVFSYDELEECIPTGSYCPGIAHLAFEVDDVETTFLKIIKRVLICLLPRIEPHKPQKGGTNREKPGSTALTLYYVSV